MCRKSVPFFTSSVQIRESWEGDQNDEVNICLSEYEHLSTKPVMAPSRMVEDRGVQRVLVGKPEGKRPLGRPRPRWEDNIKMDLQEVGGGRGDWMELAQDRDRWRAVVGTVRGFRVP